jgi:hypothetical protein
MSGFFDYEKEKSSIDFISRQVRIGDVVSTNRPGTSYRDLIPALVVGFSPKKVRLATIKRVNNTTDNYLHLVDQSKPPEGSYYYDWEVFTKFPAELRLAVKKEDVVLFDATTGNVIQ